MYNISVLIWFTLPLLVLPGNYEEMGQYILYPISRTGFRRRPSEDPTGTSANAYVSNGYHINHLKRQDYEIKKEVYRRHMNQSQNRTSIPSFAGTPFNTSRNASVNVNRTCNDMFYHGNSTAKLFVAPYIMDPLLQLQMSQDGRKVLTSLSNTFRNMSEKDINMISSVLSLGHVYVPASEGFINLLDRLWTTASGRQLIKSVMGKLNSLTSRQISQMLSLISISPQNTSTSLSLLNHFLSEQPGHDLVNGIFGGNVSANILKYVSFLTQLLTNTTPSKFSQIVANGSRLNTILMGRIRTGLTSDVTTGMQNFTVRISEAALGQDCQHSVCKVRHSACSRGKDGMSCTCLSGYLRSVNGTCITAPKKVVEETGHEYWIHPTVQLGKVVAMLPLLSVPGVVDHLYVSVDVFPRDSGIAAVINGSNISLVLISLLRYRSFMLHITASAGYTQIHQVLPVHISTRVPSELQTVSVFVLDGTRNGTLVAEIKNNFSQDYPYAFEITNAYPGQIVDIMFSLSPRGHLVLKRDVDMSLLSGNNLTCTLEAFFNVTAREEGSTRSVILANVYVLIIKNSCHYFVEENVRNITVLKNALLPFHQPHFVISISDLSQVFRYENGAVILQEYLDFENPNHRHLQLSLRIRTRDGQRETSIPANIHVEDVNDEPPVFMLPVYGFSMIKGSPRGTIIGIVKAKDPDTPTQNLLYSLSGQNARFFTIGHDGAISVDVLSNPNRHFNSTVSNGLNSTVFNSFSLKVSVFDGVSRAIRDSVIKVSLVTPTIPKKNLRFDFHLRIPEHSPQGVPVGSLKTNTTIITNYTDFRVLEVQNTLKIDRKTGNITIIKDLDRESGPKVQTFTIMGVERDAYCELVILGTLHVVTEDINDHPPQFDSNSYEVSLLENDGTSIGKCVLSVTVFDPDEGKNGTSHFSLTGQYSNHFRVDTVDGKTAKIFTKKAFDRETTQHQQLFLLAKDGNASGVHTSTSVVNVYVLDVNDNAPQFVHQVGTTITIRENADPYCISNITATDKDEGINGEVSFIVAGGKGYFEIGRYNGNLCTTEKIDREVYSTFNLSLEAFDHGEPQLKSLLNITVNVLDENDNSPRFINPMITSYPENKACTSPVITMKAVDADTHKGITYNLSNAYFKINSTTGAVRCKQFLDFEKQRLHTFTVFAFDSGFPVRSASTTVVVTVLDVNDNKPVFSKSNGQFDREKKSLHQLMIKAHLTNGSDFDLVLVSIHVTDLNDNKPRFKPTNNMTIYLNETIPIGSLVTNITATDPDIGPNGNVTYMLSPKTGNY
ncbi:fat-like cadherin-related tumor suppressor homolog [Haliotis asinina]|uniref:fat-like cadherin-related tumor suppressor homolog n=1 Tax=Haliotis asinina TaxID=109174 RepID=UPI003531DDFB